MPLLNAPPYAWSDAKGQAQGLYPDIAVALAKVTGLEINIDVVPFARAARTVADGSADATLMFSNAFTAGKVHEARVVFYATQVVQLRPGLAAHNRQDLVPLTLGRMNGGCMDLAEDTKLPWKFQELSNQVSGVRMLATKRIDGFCTTSEAIADALASSGLASEFAQAQKLELSSKPVWLMLSTRLTPAVASRLEAGVKELQKTGAIDRIFQARLGGSYVLRLSK